MLLAFAVLAFTVLWKIHQENNNNKSMAEAAQVVEGVTIKMTSPVGNAIKLRWQLASNLHIKVVLASCGRPVANSKRQEAAIGELNEVWDGIGGWIS